jgi:hypothetical protein
MDALQQAVVLRIGLAIYLKKGESNGTFFYLPLLLGTYLYDTGQL